MIVRWRKKMFDGLPRGGGWREGFAKSQARLNPSWSAAKRRGWLPWCRRLRGARTRAWANWTTSGVTEWESNLPRLYKRKIERIRSGSRKTRLGRCR